MDKAESFIRDDYYPFVAEHEEAMSDQLKERFMGILGKYFSSSKWKYFLRTPQVTVLVYGSRKKRNKKQT